MNQILRNTCPASCDFTWMWKPLWIEAELLRIIRGTCYGISAAIGKTGAAVGTQAFTPIQNNLGKK